MFFTPDEMGKICALHQGTFSETLEALRWSAGQITNPESKAVFDGIVKKLSEMKPGETVSLAFEPEK